MLKKLPYGIIAGLSGIFLFYDTIGIIVLYIVFSQIAAQTTQSATIFDSWYQVLMFIFDVIFVVCFVFSLFMFIRKKKTNSNHKELVKEGSK